MASFQPRCLQVCPSEPSCEGSRLLFPIHPLPEPPALRCSLALLPSAGHSVHGSVAFGSTPGYPRLRALAHAASGRTLAHSEASPRHWRRPSLYNMSGLSKPPSLPPTSSPCLPQPCLPVWDKCQLPASLAIEAPPIRWTPASWLPPATSLPGPHSCSARQSCSGFLGPLRLPCVSLTLGPSYV